MGSNNFNEKKNSLRSKTKKSPQFNFNYLLLNSEIFLLKAPIFLIKCPKCNNKSYLLFNHICSSLKPIENKLHSILSPFIIPNTKGKLQMELNSYKF